MPTVPNRFRRGLRSSDQRINELGLADTLQLLPPKQLAVVVLRDVLGFPAQAVAEMMNTTVESVTSALKRARANLERRLTGEGRSDAPIPHSPAELRHRVGLKRMSVVCR
jgi:DNA-directed RNA polymerase specialized sigma24 family protein